MPISNNKSCFYIGEGTIDMDLINTGVSASERMRRDILVSSIRDITLEKMQIGGSAMRLSEVCCCFTPFVIPTCHNE